MAKIRFARLSFQKKLTHYADERSAHERRMALLSEVIDYYTDVNAHLKGTSEEDKINVGN